MDYVVIKPSSKPLNFISSYPKSTSNSFSTFLFSSFSKLKRPSTSISVSSTPTNNPNPLNPGPETYNYTKPISHLSNLTKKWVSILQGSDSGYLQNGGFGTALLSLTATARVRLSPFMATLAANPTFVSGFFAWMVAQSVKVVLNFFVEKKWDLRIMFASGGMPSSHSALCTALTTSVAICHGVADSLFPVCLGFSLIVMYDAIGVRRHAGMQAEVLNMIVADLFQGHPISQRKLKELLGHTPSQVVAGALVGVVVACVCCQGCFVAT
ncbi:hypothetical protein RHSIM_Rhsim07G0004200 [Rhododendron simsii]|uniref:Acid phosphatase/vanadium-dependent haloperoxidase-related protein n=1 Tax=Rhododendron simsii TaxID=118357 RepID=A0A834GMG5_RHOSS|nr:hypothetical protein RHSIM_Rhsim07G0004200 [Rhododendron simsii]